MLNRQYIYNNFLKQIPAKKTINKYLATNEDLQYIILNSIEAGKAQVIPFANMFRGKNDFETAKNIYNFLQTQKTYTRDFDEQIIRLPSNFLSTQYGGDCKSYTNFIASLLCVLNIPNNIVFTAYDSKHSNPSHVYNEVIYNGQIIPIDGVYKKGAGLEKPFKKKFVTA